MDLDWFEKRFRKLCAAYNRFVDKDLLDVYFLVLHPLSEEEFQAAALALIDDPTVTKLPPPAAVRELGLRHRKQDQEEARLLPSSMSPAELEESRDQARANAAKGLEQIKAAFAKSQPAPSQPAKTQVREPVTVIAHDDRLEFLRRQAAKIQETEDAAVHAGQGSVGASEEAGGTAR